MATMEGTNASLSTDSGSMIDDAEKHGWSEGNLQKSEMRVELIFITTLCSILTLGFIVNSMMSICKAKSGMNTQLLSYKARNPLYNIILVYLISIACYTLTIFVGSMVPLYAPFFDILLDFFILTAIVVWLHKWNYRMEMTVLIDFVGNLLKPEANGQKKLLRKIQSLYCQLAAFDTNQATVFMKSVHGQIKDIIENGYDEKNTTD